MTQPSEDTSIEEALQNCDIEAVRQWCIKNPNWIESVDEFGDTPLLGIIELGNLDLIRCLLDQGADPNAQGEDGNTPLTIAVDDESAESEAIMTLLISRGADVNQFGFSGSTPLHMAAARGNVAMARLLIEAGADVNRRKEIDAQETPLMDAAYAGRPEALQLLLDHGADASVKDAFHDETALEMAINAAKGPDPEVLKHLDGEALSIDVDEMFSELDLPDEQLEVLKQSVEGMNLADQYVETSKQLVENGNHAKVIRILSDIARTE